MKHSILLLSMVLLTGCSTIRCGQICKQACGLSSSSCGSCSQGDGSYCSDSQSCEESRFALNSGLGCLCTDSWKTKCAARKLANSHLPRQSCADFKDGFRQAFTDVSMGASGQVPALAPRKYWKYYGRTTAGHSTAQAWFEGYEAGAQIAVSYQDRFLDIAASHYGGFAQLPAYSSEFGY